jgi:hypothetical protein
MKSIKEFINEALTGKAKGYLWSYANWRRYLRGEITWEQFTGDENTPGDLEDLRPADQKKVKNILDDIKKSMISCGRVFLGNWGGGYGDMDESWDYFYGESGCSSKNLCLVFFQDGDDGDFYYIELKKNVNPKLVNDFKALFNSGVMFEQN